MIDIDLNGLKILPTDNIEVKDYEYIISIEKEKKLLQTCIIALLVTGVILLTKYFIKDESDKNK